MANETFTEIERKFLVKHLPDDLTQYSCHRIAQTYLSTPGQPPTLRVRRWDDTYLLTVKKHPEDDSLTIREVEISISREQYGELRDMAGDRHIEKKRYLIPWKGKTVELDIFAGKLTGLILAEIEYESEEEAEALPLPDWFAKDVTRDQRYSNNTLSRDGIPEN